ncbi:tripartite tricarboxylate transporter TctB family protein [Bosea sp. 2KB_26]|uniref:tripartite tricarboxylate transporter TctB family protein n=1 Tax=Bosea sp. 2KB_26 TaxID=3237475 RepID=UPI003F8F05E9
MMTGKTPYGDLLSGLFITALSIYIVTAAVPWGVYGAAGPGPAFFPLIYGGLMLVLGLVLLGRSLFGRRTVSAAGEPPAVDPEGRRAAMATWLALAASIPAMMLLGFLGGFFLFAFFLIKVIFHKPLITSVVAAVAITGGLYLLFQVLLDVDLPLGMFKGR